ncbi:hypothetical protein [Streptomyces sp. NPDC048361]|uniref:hypothetical protein n=1 Tax=Streptomyces sp. NPDC048361 TaxID=3154720 RepID=UPI003436A9DC
MRAQSSTEAENAQVRASAKRGAGHGATSAHGAMLALQRTAGNGAVSAMIQRSRMERGHECGSTGCGESGVVQRSKGGESEVVQRAMGSEPPVVQRAMGGEPQVIQRAKGKDWKLGSTSTELASVKAAHPGDPLVDTLHHIIPKSLFQPFLNLLTPAQVQQITTDLAPLAPAAFASPNLDKALKNVPANFRVGPRPEDRTDDPGSGLDLNTTGSGSTTPRSAQLESAFNYMEGAIAAGAVTQAEFSNKFLAPMIDACTQHGTAINIDPARATWVNDPASGKYHKP